MIDVVNDNLESAVTESPDDVSAELVNNEEDSGYMPEEVESPATVLFARSPVITNPPVHYQPSYETDSPEGESTQFELFEEAYGNVDNEKTRSEIFNNIKSQPFKLFDCNMPYNEDEGIYYEADTESRAIGMLGGIIRISIKQDKDDKTHSVRTRICDCQTMISGYYHSLDSDKDYVEITFAIHGRRDRIELRKEHVPLDSIRTTEAFKRELIPRGLSIEEANIRDMIHYYNLCVRCNDGITNTKFKSGYISEVTDWKKSGILGEHDMFVIGKHAYHIVNNRVELRDSIFVDRTNVKPSKVLEPRGTANNWANAVKREGVIDELIVRYMCYHSAATLLLSPMNEVGHTVGLIGESSKGKTFTNMIALSQFAYPGDKSGKDGLLLTGDASQAALSIMLTTYNDLPCVIDEIKLMKKDAREYILYVMANGQEPLRSEQSKRLRDRGVIRSNLLAAGETSLITKFADNGTHARSTMIKTDKPIKSLNKAVVDDIKVQIGENCGCITPFFLQAYVRHRNELEFWKRRYSAELQKATNDTIIGRKSDAFALDIVAGKLLEEIYKPLGITPMDPYTVVTDIWNKYVIDEREVPKEVTAMGDTYDYIQSLYTSKTIVKKNTQPSRTVKNVLGWSSDKYYDVRPIDYEKCMKVQGYSDDDLGGIYSKWRSNGWIKTLSKTSYKYQEPHIVNSTGEKQKVYVIRIVRDVVEQVLAKFGIFDVSNDQDVVKKAPQSWAELIEVCEAKKAESSTSDIVSDDDWP